MSGKLAQLTTYIE